MDFDLDNDTNEDLGFLPGTSDESVDNELQNLLSNVMNDNGSENNAQPETMLDDIYNNSAEENDHSTSDDPSEIDTVNSNTNEQPLDQINDDQHALNDLNKDLSIDLDDLQNNMGSADDLVHILNKDPEWTQNFQQIHVNQFQQPTGVNLP